MAFQSSSMVRTPMARRWACRVGCGPFRRDLEVRACRAAANMSQAPRSRTGFVVWLAFVGGQVVQDDDVAFLQRWDCWVRIAVSEADRAVHRRVDDPRGWVRAPQRSPQRTKVRVFQWPRGPWSDPRSPSRSQSARPGHLCTVPVSSMNTSRCACSASWAVVQRLPRLARLAHVGPIASAGLEGFF